MINRLFFLSAALMLFCFVGCADDSPAKVKGKITFNGAPLSKAMVVFYPQDGSRSSVGVTDDKGQYTLRFSPTNEGAVVGEHKVEIITAGEGGDDDTNPAAEKIPAKYNKETELKATLKNGKQVVNFDLSS